MKLHSKIHDGDRPINARPAESVDSLKLTKKGIMKTDLTNAKNVTKAEMELHSKIHEGYKRCR